jgi:hypothetical protein
MKYGYGNEQPMNWERMLSANHGGKSRRGPVLKTKKRRLLEGKRRFCYDHDM